jgi:dTDP-3-amino-3,4,6-trideoxy-alpha-D-glucose transaminase
MGEVALNDFQAQWAQVRDAALGAVDRVGRSGWLVLGAEVRAFEEALARRWGAAHCVGCASGLDALEIALRCAGLEPGGAVLTTPLSAFATTLAVVRAGGVPVFVDVDASGLLDLDLAAQALAARPEIRFLVPVHLYGHALDLARLLALRERFGLCVVEDCAQAVGARSGGAPVGSVSALAATSFYPTKNLGCMGDGGALLTDDAALAERARALRDYGQTARYVHRELGMNSRLDELQAALLHDAFLPRLDAATARRAEVAARYRAELANPRLALPPVPAGSTSVWHLFPVLVDGDRGAFQAHLRAQGVASGVHYPKAISEQEALRAVPAARCLGPIPRALDFARREVSLPIHPFLSDGDVARVVDACNGWRG